MGKINEYQRSRLASSVVGSPSIDTSGQVIAGSIADIGAALIKRQGVLDTAEATKTGYEYTAATNLAAMELMKQYQNDPSLDPLTFDAQYQEGAAVLAGEFKEKLPDRLHNKFDVLVSRANASQSITNTRWAFAQQNKNLLEGFFELGVAASTIAGNSMNSEDYLNNRTMYIEATEQYKSTMTPRSMQAATQAALKQQATMFWNNSVDYRNGGDPAKFATELGTSPGLRDTLQKDLGPKGFKTLETNLNKYITQMGLDQGFRKVVANNEQLQEKVNKLYDPANNYGLKEVAADLEEEINKKNYMVSTNNKGQNTAAIMHTEENIKNLSKLKRMAAFVNDSSYTSDLETKSELLAEIKVGMSPYRGGKFKNKLAEVKKDIARQTAKQDAKRPWYAYLNPYYRFKWMSERGMEMITKVPTEIRLEAKEDVVAKQSMSEYIETAQTLNGRVLDAVESKQITYKDGLNFINQIGMISDIEKYDSLTSNGGNWFTEGYDAFNDYVRALDLKTGSVEANRQLRDSIRNQMVNTLTQRVASFGDIPMTPDKIAGVIGQIKFEKSQQINPEIMGAKVGDYISVGGRQVEFLGFAADTGKVLVKTKGLQKAVDNQ